MKHKLKFGLAQVNAYAPKWLINVTSLVTLFIAAKHRLVAGLPLISDNEKLLAMAWVDYLLDTVQVVLAVAVIFTGKTLQKDTYDDTTGNNHN